LRLSSLSNPASDETGLGIERTCSSEQVRLGRA
jgi:hypothetical protein